MMAIGLSCTSTRVEPCPTCPPPGGKDSSFTITNPFWSSDGKRILFIGHIFGLEGYDFYEVDSAGGVARLVMRDSLAKRTPVLSPDGLKIAYLAADISHLFSATHVWLMNADGTGAHDLTPFGGNWENIRWSPDDHYLIFEGGVRDSGIVNYQIGRVDVQSGEVTFLTRGNYGNRDASYIAGGAKIAFTSGRIPTDYGGKVWVMNADGTMPVPIDTSPTASTNPRTSPARDELFFAWGLGGEADAGTYLINLDSTILPARPSSFESIYPRAGLDVSQWSPDGNLILYLVGTSALTSDLFIIDRNGSNSRRLTTNLQAFLFTYAWSPEGKRLAFLAKTASIDTIGIYVYSLNTNTLKRLSIGRN